MPENQGGVRGCCRMAWGLICAPRQPTIIERVPGDASCAATSTLANGIKSEGHASGKEVLPLLMQRVVQPALHIAEQTLQTQAAEERRTTHHLHGFLDSEHGCSSGDGLADEDGTGGGIDRLGVV